MALESQEENKRHLKPLPTKSFTVAPGDVVGGMIYVMDKPLGIEEGMVGMSIDSPGYRQYLIETIVSLDHQRRSIISAGNTEMSALQKKYNSLIKNKDFDFYLLEESEKNIIIDLFMHHPNIQNYLNNLDESEKERVLALKEKCLNINPNEPLHKKNILRLEDNIKKLFSKRMHEIKYATYTNEGMGGLLFQSYKAHCRIKENEHFASQIKKLIFAKNESPSNEVFMVKQDGKLGLFHGTGPGISKILKTSTGKKLQENFTIPKLFTIVLPLYTVAQIGIRRLGYLIKNKPTDVNTDAITETIATKLAGIRGCDAQQIETLAGTYEDGSPKITTLVTWTPDCQDLSSTNRVMGNQSSLDGLIVAQTQSGETLKRTSDGVLLYRKELQDQETGQFTGYAYYTNDNITPITSDNMEEYQKISHAYQEACYITEDRIDGIGEALITLIAQGDRDALGKKGQNKAIVPKEDGRFNFFGIDFGKAYANERNPLLASLEDDFSFISPDARIGDAYFSNYSALYDNSLREKMKGIYLLAALRGELTDPRKEEIAKEYEDTDLKFATKLRNMNDLNQDLKLIDKEIDNYKKQIESNPKVADEFQIYIAKLEKIKRTVQATDKVILDKFSERSKLLPTQIDALEAMEKLCARKAHITKLDGKTKILRKHIWVSREDRIAWQINANNQLVCRIDSPLDLSEIQEKVNKLVKLLKDKADRDPTQAQPIQELLNSLSSHKFSVGENTLPAMDWNLFNNTITEDSIAKIHDLKEYISQEQRNELSKIRDSMNRPSNANNQNNPSQQSTQQPTQQLTQQPTQQPTQQLTQQPTQQLTQQPTQQLTQQPTPNMSHESLMHNLNVAQTEPTVQTSKGKEKTRTPALTLSSIGDVLHPEPMSPVAQHTLNEFSHWDAYIDKFKDFHNIENIEKSKSGAYQQLDARVITFSNPIDSAITTKVYAQKISNELNYSIHPNSSGEEFNLAAQEICRLVVCSKSSKKIYLPDSLNSHEKETVRKAFDQAVTEAIKQGKLNNAEIPKLLTKNSNDQPKVPIKPKL